MAQEKKVKRAVRHPRLYKMVGGKLKMVPVGTIVEVTETEAANRALLLVDPASAKSLDSKGNMQTGDTPAALPEEIQTALAEMQKKLDASDAENKKLKAAAKKS